MLAMLALIGFALYQTGESEAVEIGQTAPDFELTTLDGKTVRLSEFRGKGVLINFWASWCKPCRIEMPLLISAQGAHQEHGLVVLAINLTDQERSMVLREEPRGRLILHRPETGDDRRNPGREKRTRQR